LVIARFKGKTFFIIMNYFLKALLIISLLLSAICDSNGQSIVINEMMSLNNSLIFDEDGDDSDWIEIYNTTTDVINLCGYFLSDTDDNIQRWAFPDTIIQPKQFMLIYASGKNRAIAGKGLHTDFSIKASGESLILSHLGDIVHRVAPIGLESNTSYGLKTDGQGPFVIFYNPTPGVSNNQAPIATNISFSKQGGIYQNTFDLSIFSDSNQASIYYTTNGTSPTPSSHLYTKPLQLNADFCSKADISQVPIYPEGTFEPPSPETVPKAVVIRAAAFDQNGNQISDVKTNSYFIKDSGIDHHQLPIISICAEHNDLFHNESGIFVPGKHWNSNEPNWTGNYYQTGKEWEREINLEYYEPNVVAINHKAGLRTHGGNGRRFPQKGMRLYARDDYSTSYFEHPFFEDKPIVRYKRLVLKPFQASWNESGLGDYLTHKMAQDINVDWLATKLVVVYLNGEYWGLYNLQERIDDWYIKANHGIDTDKIDLIGNWHGMTEYGDNNDFLALYDFIENNDLSISLNYETVSNWMDIENFIDYQLFEIFIANYDWPANNMKCWREKDSNKKWRWIYIDGDAALGNYHANSFLQALNSTGEGWPTNPTATLFLRKLLENEDFKTAFLNRLQELLNNQFSFTKTNSIYLKAIEILDHEIPKQIKRFSFPTDYDKWREHIYLTEEFLAKRESIIIDQVKDLFNTTLTDESSEFEEVVLQKLGLHPNPNNGDFSITFNSPYTTSAYIIIYNQLGQAVASFNQLIIMGDNVLKYSIKDLPNELLFINVVTEKHFFSTKMIKQQR
jgi:hypothetical protein